MNKTTAKTAYDLTIGEVGNERGHKQTIHCKNDETAIATAKRICTRDYQGDGWYILSIGFTTIDRNDR